MDFVEEHEEKEIPMATTEALFEMHKKSKYIKKNRYNVDTNNETAALLTIASILEDIRDILSEFKEISYEQ